MFYPACQDAYAVSSISFCINVRAHFNMEVVLESLPYPIKPQHEIT